MPWGWCGTPFRGMSSSRPFAWEWSSGSTSFFLSLSLYYLLYISLFYAYIRNNLQYSWLLAWDTIYHNKALFISMGYLNWACHLRKNSQKFLANTFPHTFLIDIFHLSTPPTTQPASSSSSMSFIRWATAFPLGTVGSLRLTFVPAWLVGLAVKLPYAFAHEGWFPSLAHNYQRKVRILALPEWYLTDGSIASLTA